MNEVIVEYDYVGKESDELTIKKGDIIKDVIKKAGGWWEGVLKDKKGMFPDNFVRPLDKDSVVVLRNSKDVSRIRQCRVVFSYNQDHEDELNLKLCYNGQNCQMIPLSLAHIYGSKVESLDLSYNELVSIRGIEEFTQLKELILDNNQLTDQIVIPYLPEVHTISLNKNKIEDLPLLVSKIYANLPKLTFLSLIGNKACTNELSGDDNDEKDYQRYRCYVLYHLPNLKFLDSRKVGESEKREAKRRGKFMNVIKPCVSIPFIDINEMCYDTSTNTFNPLPKTLRGPDDCKGAYGKRQYRYSGKNSEGNRFISNKDL